MGNVYTFKDRNIFWMSLSMNALVSLIGAFFVGSFFYLANNFFDYGWKFHFFLFLDTGLSLLIIIIFSKKNIVEVV